MSRDVPPLPALLRPPLPRTDLAGRAYLDSLRPDCRHFDGYKPCGYQYTCLDCPHFAPRGARLCLIKLGAMGDVLRTTTLLGALRVAHPGGFELTWVTMRESLPLLRHHRDIARLVAIEDFPAVLALDGLAFDALLCLDKEPPALGLAARLRAARKLGFAPDPRGGLGVWNDASAYALQLGLDDILKFRLNTKTYPAIIHEMAELPYAGEEYELAPGADTMASRDAWRARHGGATPVIGVNPGSGRRFPTKQWPDARVLEFAAEVRRRAPAARVLLLGGPDESARNDRLAAASEGALIHTPTDQTLDQFIGLVASLDVLVTTDTLAMHLAIGARVPVVALLGSTSATEIDLFGRGEKIVSDFPCAPCYLKTCPQPVFCMDELPGDRVATAALAVASSARRPPQPVAASARA